MKRRLVSVLLAACAASTNAQNVVSVDLLGQPLQYMKDGRVNGCGLRVMAVRVSSEALVESSEVSVNLYSSGHAMVKAIAYAPYKFKPGQPPVLKSEIVTAGWLKAPGAAATSPVGKAVPGEDKVSQVYITSVDSVVEVIMAQREGKEVQLVVKRRGEPSYFIMTGKVKLEDAEERQFAGCLDELFAQFRGNAPADQ